MSAVLSVRGLSKTFVRARALRSVDFDVEEGSVHGVMGENGAGKSTLMNILAGAFPPNPGGEIFLHGSPVHFQSTKEAQSAGIGIVHQELNLAPTLTVAENLFLGHEPRVGGIFLDKRRLQSDSEDLLARFGVRIDPRRQISDLSPAQRQLIEIAKTLAFEPKIVIFDEPTSSLSNAETKTLYRIIADLKRSGVTMLYISHRMREIFDLCDHVSVLRDGQHVGTSRLADISEDDLVKQMVGREIQAVEKRRAFRHGAEPALKVTGLTNPGKYQDVSLSVYPGEIVGLAGLIGAGRSELALGIFGVDPPKSGAMTFHGAAYRPNTPREAMNAGVALVPEDRKLQGLVLPHAIRHNVTLAHLPRLAAGPMRRRSAEAALVEQWSRQLSIKASSEWQPVQDLSGGNQQKVLLAKWLATQPRFLILDEPTRGVDVGTKAEIYALMQRLADNGLALLVISSDMPELLTVSERILVMREGRLVGEIGGDGATEERIMALAAQKSQAVAA